MAQQVSFTPLSPIFLRDSTSPSFPAHSHYSSGSPNTDDISSTFERRRSLHPHNQLFNRPNQAGMMENTYPPTHPHLEHRTSQTIIDLTDDADEPIVPRRSSDRRRRPPQLGRSDSLALGDLIDFADVIDLTEDTADGEPEVMFTRSIPLPPPTPARRPRRLEPPLGFPRRTEEHHHHHHHHTYPLPRVIPNAFGAFGALGAYIGLASRGIPGSRMFMGSDDSMEEFLEPVLNLGNMPHAMNYQANAYEPAKPEHVPPEMAAEGFTRSPENDDIVICPCCEEELIHRPDAVEEPMVKGNKPPTRKEREEHPFWVLKECGHVYCNLCYQHRVPSAKAPRKANFRELVKNCPGKKPAKTLLCAVESCDSEVRSKEKWVGVFL